MMADYRIEFDVLTRLCSEVERNLTVARCFAGSGTSESAGVNKCPCKHGLRSVKAKTNIILAAY